MKTFFSNRTNSQLKRYDTSTFIQIGFKMLIKPKCIWFVDSFGIHIDWFLEIFGILQIPLQNEFG